MQRALSFNHYLQPDICNDSDNDEDDCGDNDFNEEEMMMRRSMMI